MQFPTITARNCRKLLGHMAACTYVVRHAKLRLHPPQSWLVSVHRPARHSLDRIVTLPRPILDSLPWWTDIQQVCSGVPFAAPQPSLVLVMNASDFGWGAHLGEHRTQSLWLQTDLRLHINVREVRMVHLACQSFCPYLTGRCVSVTTDNMTGMIYINKWECTLLSPVPGSPQAMGLLYRTLNL